jgi:hypothetical protein
MVLRNRNHLQLLSLAFFSSFRATEKAQENSRQRDANWMQSPPFQSE